jgi:cytochrome c oxidase subunit III
MSAHAVAAHGHDHDHHGPPHPDEWPSEELYGPAHAGKLGMWIFLLSDALMFAGLLLGYGILRGGSEYWRCSEAWAEKIGCRLEPDLGINFTAFLTFWLICSSVTMVLAYAACLERNRKGMVTFLGLTVLGGLGFLTGQYTEYFGLFGHGNLTGEGLHFGESHYASTFFVVTSFHGGHVLTGTIYNFTMMVRAAMGKYDDGNYAHIEICGLFWHFVDLIWILVFTLVYLVPQPIPT